MDYINTNKEAWEEVFENKRDGWGEDNYIRIKTENLPFLHQNIVNEVKNMDFNGKKVAQFCCNNGRELLSLMQLGAEYGIGFDIAENIITQARETSNKTGYNCEFIACDILKIDKKYYNKFDFIFITIGAITWFENIEALFNIASNCLKSGGTILLHDFHPFMNMLPLPGDDDFDSNNLNKLIFNYFRKEPWLENCGMEYMTPKYDSKTFTSFSHTTASIIGSLIKNGFVIRKFDEFDEDVGLTEVYNNKGYPLAFIIVADKS